MYFIPYNNLTWPPLQVMLRMFKKFAQNRHLLSFKVRTQTQFLRT